MHDTTQLVIGDSLNIAKGKTVRVVALSNREGAGIDFTVECLEDTQLINLTRQRNREDAAEQLEQNQPWSCTSIRDRSELHRRRGTAGHTAGWGRGRPLPLLALLGQPLDGPVRRLDVGLASVIAIATDLPRLEEDQVACVYVAVLALP